MPKHHPHPPHRHGHPHHGPGHHLARYHESLLYSGGDQPEQLLDGIGHYSASETLNRFLPAHLVTGMLRAMTDCPYEIRALFQLQIAAIEHQLKGLERVGAPVPQFDPYDLAKGNETLDALSISLSAPQQHRCLEDAMAGPLEVQAVAIVSLLSLRVAGIASAPAQERETDE